MSNTVKFWFNPSSYGPFYPRRLTASGCIEPGSSGHMWPGRETAYPFSPPPTADVAGPSTRSLLSRYVSIFFCCLPSWQLNIWIYLLFWKLKRNIKFGILVALSRALSLPPSAPSARSELGGAVTWQVLFFLSRVAGFPRPRSHMTCIFGFFFLFAE